MRECFIIIKCPIIIYLYLNVISRDEILRVWVKGLSLWPMVVVISLCTVVIATFISHTIAAVLIVPVAAQVGEAMDDPRPRLLILVRTKCNTYNC